MFVSVRIDEVIQLFQLRERDAAELCLFDRCLLRAEETEVGGSVPRRGCVLTHESRLPRKHQRLSQNDYGELDYI